MKALVKEIFIGVLLLMVVVFTLGILFYDSMPNNKATSTSITYTADSKVTATIQQITEEKANSAESSDSSDSSGLDIGSVLASYSIGSTDLSEWESRKTYESGKVDPFADYQEETPAEDGNPDGQNNNSQNGNNNSNSNSSSSSSSNNNDDSTGKLFENKNSK